ncbi:hypothetical protein CRENBAI_021227 [Crenichthys baileyi]|uniref:Uncharacterized protein n=1 Tax=Crenichthys baileyi TaxID=28760 RepID=A0AAV9REQ0_9TELE
MHVATVERKNSLLTRRNLQQNQAQCERPSATTDWGLERTEQRHKENKEAMIQEYFLWEGKDTSMDYKGNKVLILLDYVSEAMNQRRAIWNVMQALREEGTKFKLHDLAKLHVHLKDGNVPEIFSDPTKAE